MLARQRRSGAAIQHKSLSAPDEVRRFPLGTGELVRFGSLTIGRGTLEPGWRWSTSLKSIQGTSSCQIHHLQLLLAGLFHVEMDDGETAEFGPGDVFDIPPGHDIVDSTRTAARPGDAAWKQLLAEHNRLIRTTFDRFRGREVNTTGDGFLATFGSAAGSAFIPAR
jgi:hypothetical protein